MTTATGPVEEERREGRVDFAESMSLQVWTTVIGVGRVRRLNQWLILWMVLQKGR